jgi:hypothetical protein
MVWRNNLDGIAWFFLIRAIFTENKGGLAAMGRI